MESLEYMQTFDTLLLDEALRTIKLFCEELDLDYETEKKYYLSLTSQKEKTGYLKFMTMKIKKQKKKLETRCVSKCCGAKISNNVIMKKTQGTTGTTVYFICSSCGKPCNTKLVRVLVDADNITPSGEPNRFRLRFKNQ